MKMPIPRLYLGTMTFGWSQASSKVEEIVAMDMVKRFIRHNEESSSDVDEQVVYRIDTARIYAGGKTETIVGAVLSKLSSESDDVVVKGKILVGTKAHPTQTGGLSKAGIENQWQESTEALKRMPSSSLPMIDEYYLHQPDTLHSLHESLEYAHELVLQKKASKIGMSNYHASEVKRAFELCKEMNLTPPTVYQGLYNPLNRIVEKDLLPLLKANNCSFVAYNPLAAGLLAGKHTSIDNVQKGRFKNNPNYLPRFYTPANFAAIELIRKACEADGISMVEATFRWLLCHSALGEHDGVLLGASSVEQLDQNLDACTAARTMGPLSDDVLQAFDEGWKLTEDGAYPYWRSYSADMPNREALDQGASYVTK